MKTLTLIHKHFGNFDADLETVGKLWRSFGNIVQTLRLVQKDDFKKQTTPESTMLSLTLVQKQMKLFQKHPRNFGADSKTSWKVWSWFRNRWSSFRNSLRPMISKFLCCTIKILYRNASRFQKNVKVFLLNWWCLLLNYENCIFIGTKITIHFFRFSVKSLAFHIIVRTKLDELLWKY